MIDFFETRVETLEPEEYKKNFSSCKESRDRKSDKKLKDQAQISACIFLDQTMGYYHITLCPISQKLCTIVLP